MVLTLTTATLSVVGGTALAPTAQAAATWTSTKATVFGMGDSLFAQCGDTLGLGARSLGMVGWWGGTSQDMRNRMTSTAEDWPYTSERSHAEELADFRQAGSWVVGLGTNDVVVSTAAQFRANVEWFMQQSQGRPVQWFNIHHPQYAAKADAYNAVLNDAATRWPNLRILDWHGHATTHPRVIAGDQLHIADHAAGCDNGRFRLIQSSVPQVSGTATQPPFDTPVAVPRRNPVDTRYATIGPARLGHATTSTACDLKKDGCVRGYTKGLIAWSPKTGARAITSTPIRDSWSGYFAQSGPLGYPVQDTVCRPRSGGCTQRFETGSISWSPATGAVVSVGGIRSTWTALGAERSFVGHPTTNTYCGLVGSGCFQTFQGGSMHWSPDTGAHVTRGAIQGAWAAGGWETGVLGYPTGNENCGLRDGGCFQVFQGGTIHWSPARGAHVTRGAIYDAWADRGWETGALGYPTGNETCGLRKGGCFQPFQGGIMHWSPASGAHVTRGAIHATWASTRWETGKLGYPTGNENCGLREGGCFQTFQGGTIHWSPASGAHALSGAILRAWAKQGWETGRLGYPTGGRHRSGSLWKQRFQGGLLRG
ncbi:hypothetical protein GCM10023328_21040 [Modestobacter marinus]|uniref:SGNH hydrolase-type esterase domain-containing protein n=1 Tax=Modestobacter marinus TaxID=477641 RepID=A0ABQ2FYK6_9ACTN|nr:hypothetical protein GCM10011589_23250 [Modestobacter marinus]